MEFPAIYTDEQGETHFGVQEIPSREAAVGPSLIPPGRQAT
jgi:hypothetical protein